MCWFGQALENFTKVVMGGGRDDVELKEREE